MKQGSTIFLRIVIWLIGLGVLIICLFPIPLAVAMGDPGAYSPILLGLYFPAVPFFVALYQALKLLSYIDKNKAFSNLSVKALKIIKYCALTISGLFVAGMPYIFYAADKDDAPGVILIGLVIIFASLIFAVFAAVLQKLIEDGLAIKSENDLTV